MTLLDNAAQQLTDCIAARAKAHEIVGIEIATMRGNNSRERADAKATEAGEKLALAVANYAHALHLYINAHVTTPS